ncbi:MAG: ABC transporter ATP-binding protein [Candidatus Eisenbacteria bacterium]|uniref:ABC transporter ATP-binding protein n=1 Tax=Eiseniibacteriota bacterium TaxID=2212470 RepID=A0A7Y2H1A5_UNCEI|nr:ABC transporter ATP-binding protein [Candidatus Eisenbacteria bacterium]
MKPAIEVSALRKSYGRVQAVCGVSFQVTPGETLGIIGPNGAGKSTLLKILLGLVRPDSGSVRIGGIDLERDPVAARRFVGYVPQKDGFEESSTVSQALCYMARLRGVDLGEVAERAAQVGVKALLDRKVETLSGGQRQRVSLAASLLGDPPILLLDEPTASLDPRATAEFRELVQSLASEGRTIVLCSHLLSDVERLCHRVLVLLDGAIAGIEENQGQATTSMVFKVSDSRSAKRIQQDWSGSLVQLDALSFQVHTSPQEQMELLTWLVSNNIRVETFETRRPSLEERFLSRLGETEV